MSNQSKSVLILTVVFSVLVVLGVTLKATKTESPKVKTESEATSVRPQEQSGDSRFPTSGVEKIEVVLEPNKATAAVGEEVEVSLLVLTPSNQAELAGVDIVIQHDPEMVEFVDRSAGDYWDNSIDLSNQSVAGGEQGIVKYSLGRSLDSGVSGKTKLASFRYLVKPGAQGSLNFSLVTDSLFAVLENPPRALGFDLTLLTIPVR